ncbi:MAG TPA: redoxin family protein, partial [Candidatus Krumholzibacterium sp.]|nr:redoxin family protein [Candidatus Krumholzibacterium sp.]
RTTAILLVLAALVIAAPLATQDRAAEAMEELNAMMKTLEGQRGSMPMDRLIDSAERQLLEFIEKYPDTPATGSAYLTLGQIYMGINKNDAAEKYFGLYFKGEFEKRPDESNMARLMLGNLYVQMARFDEAEIHFKAIVDDPAADSRSKAMAETTLDRMEVLKSMAVGKSLEDFSATATDGKPISLSQYRGKVVLVDFWATWCAPCRAELPNVKKVYEEYGRKGFDIVGISLDNDCGKLEEFVKTEEMKWRQVCDGQGWKAELGQKYAVASIPATLLLDRDGVIRYKNLRGDELVKAVKELIEKE